MIKSIFLDIDNTLLDFDAYVKKAMKDGFEKFDLKPYEDYMYSVFEKTNSVFWKNLEKGIITYDELLKERWNAIFANLGISFDGIVFEKYFKACLFDSAIPVDGAIEALDYLKDRYILCAASNGPYEQQFNRLKIGGMLPYFSHLFISERVGFSKPSSEFFAHCMNVLNEEREDLILPSEVMMIGDSLSSDISGALNFGIKACFFDIHRSADTKGLVTDHVITSLSEIKTIL